MKTLVNINSGTLNIEGVKNVGTIVQAKLNDLGFTTRWENMPTELNRAGHLVATQFGKKGKRVLLIGHLDTVFEPSPLNIPFKVMGRRATGNGVQDMKGGVVSMLLALEALKKTGALEDRTIVVVLLGDEEHAGRPLAISRKTLMDIARQSDVALGFEFGSDSLDSSAILSRRGISRWILDVSAKSAHSSKIYQEDTGSGAIMAAVQFLQSFRNKLVELEGVTFNPGIILGGTMVNYEPAVSQGGASGKANVVASRTMIEGDLRFTSGDQEKQAKDIMLKVLEEKFPHAIAKVSFVEGYPAMSNSVENEKLLHILSQVSLDLGGSPVTSQDNALRGAADISFAAPYVSAALDGLGAIGGKAHTAEEWLDLDAYSMVIKRAALLIYRLTHP
ncbi:hypothetical protein B0T45_23180 [Chromobacterium haemolyticum]|uniref:Peptidase M20 dimerisation domain-containing protein n=1 Tax=Chromobacterium haemolyticum TaxID=394935 RepID=A0A1W0C8Y4_9NEIS|nr:hypothetical protein B0T45_23180 [Chromobacterium haemolyticum]